MLNAKQINLLAHLKRFAVADQDTCVLALDSDKTQNKDKLLYTLRPLVKNEYISRRSDELYGLLHKGTELVSTIKPIITAGGDTGSRKRVVEVSHMAALLGWHKIPTVTSIPPDGQNGFIPSAIWRTLRNGIISTTHFLGVLFYNDLRLAVYHIGNGDYDWQLRPECSLHFSHYDEYGLRLTGILLVCNDGCGVNVGKQIIRRTLWERDTLLKRSYCQNTRPVRYSTSPVRVRADYKHAFLAEEHEIPDVLRMAERDETSFERFAQTVDGGIGGLGHRFAVESNKHHYLSISNDLLHLACFYSDVKRQEKGIKENWYIFNHGEQSEHHLHLPERYAEWGTFLKLPVTIHPLTEEDIHCLTT